MAFNWFKKKTQDNSKENLPDFSRIDSNEKALDLYNKKELEKIYLMPLEFGGEDNLLNVIYAPIFTKTLKDKFDLMAENLLEEGKKLNYSAIPEYKGDSFIASKLILNITGDTNFKETINIW